MSPLFNIPSCVIFLAADQSIRHIAARPGKEFIGRLPERDPSIQSAKTRVISTDVTFDLAYLGKRSAWRKAGSHMVQDASVKSLFIPGFYVSRFRQGAVLYPQTLLIVQTDSGATPQSGDVNVRTNEAAAATAKLAPQFRWERVVDASTVFSTYAADHLLPFCLKSIPWEVVLPVSTNPHDSSFAPQDPNMLRKSGRVLTADWLDMAEAKWQEVRKPGEKLALWERIDYMKQLSSQGGMKRFVVLYTASGGRTVAAVLDTQAQTFPFVARDKTYWTSTSSEAEAHYLCAFLNSDYVHERIKDFMTRGLMGPRDIHKRVLDIPWPEFISTDMQHTELAILAKGLAGQAKESAGQLMARDTGRARTELRGRLDAGDLARLESLVEKISKS